ncbi:OmpA family protein [Pararhodospirillum oryzae]|uniref:OmpA-like domain-containing protein n=1 Tax=Pararhodospirillum oryzae TaxID=478448 RepID=A0A512H4J0_9PROT|nr:OmpA family protein [Pararhodospirillum oryzae]GEO80357.1 hypothetical protein ROR02_04880 [Pararhodospirillum oryzae]
MPFAKLLAFALAGLMLAGCETYGPMTHNMSAFDWGDTKPLEELTTAPRSGSAFTNALADGYQAMAQSELDKRDWRDQQRWARKGLLAAEGAVVHPELPDRWDLVRVNYAETRVDGTTYKDLYDRREDLMETFYACGTREKDPALSAQAQLGFDCLVEELDEGWETPAITECRDTFEAALARLKTYCGKTETGFVILFPTGSSELSLEARALVGTIARAAGTTRPVTLTGWADTVGNASANLALSARRVAAIKSALVAAGVPSQKISETARGNQDLPVTTGPNVANPSNRAVHIVVGS